MRSMLIWQKARVIHIEPVAEDVRAVTFAIEGEVPAYDPGSHSQIRVKIGALDAIRTYTVVPSEPGTLRIAVKRNPNSRGGSAYIWSLAIGDETEMTIPENRFELSWRASHYLLIAGGIGVTPIYGMARVLAERGQSLRMIYGAAQRSQMAFADELAALLGDRIEFFVQSEGRAFDLAAEIAALPTDGEAYVCGPLGLLEAVKAAWAEAGRVPSRLRYEVFGDSGKFSELPFEVEIRTTGQVVGVRSDQSLLEALLQSGVDMVFDCQRGECGLCAVDIVETQAPVDHRDVFFSGSEKQENARMCACVSRLVGGRAVIDTGYRP
ncbi:PDR/VanB family oxidoreductase [Rhizobium alvei]|uniref:PDR/VanB family oxidoreductase n=1 Tax=Rhizobium alvei TaxID=1132659 RepID=A0ABT8YNS5_9HYPH|nr:PDR/VanB family oxidoreductase [Rhizobium alvei]MDO6965368.1 PDR/VanB family oxidoreductase [Rhizobium alvei]